MSMRIETRGYDGDEKFNESEFSIIRTTRDMKAFERKVDVDLQQGGTALSYSILIVA